MDWNDVRIFLALAQAGSLTQAARLLDVEHSTVARRVDALERALKLRLFDRLPRGWQLTAEGERLIAHAERMRDEADGLLREVAGASGLSGTVRLSAPPMFASLYLIPRLAPLAAAWPGIALEVAGESQQINLSRREADLALRMAQPDAPDLVARRLADVGFALYAQPAYLAGKPADAWGFLGYDESMSHVPQQRWLTQQAGGRPFALRSNDLAIVHQAARVGLGVAVLPHFLAADDPQLVRIDSEPCPVTRSLWLVMHPDVRRSPRVRRVADALAETIQADADWLREGSKATPRAA